MSLMQGLSLNYVVEIIQDGKIKSFIIMFMVSQNWFPKILK